MEAVVQAYPGRAAERGHDRELARADDGEAADQEGQHSRSQRGKRDRFGARALGIVAFE